MRQLNDETLEGLAVAYLDNHLDAEERILVQGLKTGGATTGNVSCPWFRIWKLISDRRKTRLKA